jgi:hypothetical protein
MKSVILASTERQNQMTLNQARKQEALWTKIRKESERSTQTRTGGFVLHSWGREEKMIGSIYWRNGLFYEISLPLPYSSQNNGASTAQEL